MSAAGAAHRAASGPVHRLVVDLVTGLAGRADEDHRGKPACFAFARMITDLRLFVDPTSRLDDRRPTRLPSRLLLIGQSCARTPSDNPDHDIENCATRLRLDFI